MRTIEAPWYPIIYVRGYAGNDTEIDDTVSEPYMGFNLGSTKFRQLWNGSVRRHYFESPLFRLVKDFGYTDVYSGGQEMPIDMDVSPKSIFIYRYYDSQFFDDLIGKGPRLDDIEGKARPIEDFANGLGALIERIKKRLCGDDPEAHALFKVYLVGHSMGGLVCRCFLQNPDVSSKETKALVDKVFTYATPHNGIDLSVIGNVPGFFTRNDADNFNRARMAAYLGLVDPSNVANLNGQYSAERFFCLVGTNWQDYTAAAGWSRRLTGPMSDGLVRIANATVFNEPAGGTKQECPRAFVHRSHSGQFGIVNSEEGYQNLVRFLFGDVRVDGVLELSEITLPTDVEKAWKQEGKDIKASYHFEVVIRVRGYDWDLHRRTVREESAIFRKFDEMFPKDPEERRRNPQLFSVFLSTKSTVNKRRKSLGFSIELGVLVPDYEIDGILWRNQHFAGSYLFRDTLTIEATPPDDGETITASPFLIRYGLDSKTPNRAPTKVDLLESPDGSYVFEIPLKSGTKPGLTGKLVLTARSWG